MLCYRDRAYCSRVDCQTVGCDRLVTEEVKARARAAKLPLDLQDFQEPDCGCVGLEGSDSGLRTRDAGRLSEQRERVKQFMAGLDPTVWVTLAELSAAVGAPEASVSARLRDFRKKRYGSHTVEKRRWSAGGATYEYRVLA